MVKTIGCCVEDSTIDAINEYVNAHEYPTKSDFLREAVMEKIGSAPSPEEVRLDSISKSLEALNSKIDSISTAKPCACGQSNRVMMFMDVMNVAIGMDEARPNTEDKVLLDYTQLRNQLLGDRKLVRAYAYDSAYRDEIKGTTNANFHVMLEHSGWDMVTRPMGSEQKQKEVDMAMGVSLITEADNYDIAIVISGDRDFLPAIEAVKHRGKTVEVASFRQNLSTMMEKAADRTIYLDNLFLISLRSPGETAQSAKATARKGVTA